MPEDFIWVQEEDAETSNIICMFIHSTKNEVFPEKRNFFINYMLWNEFLYIPTLVENRHSKKFVHNFAVKRNYKNLFTKKERLDAKWGSKLGYFFICTDSLTKRKKSTNQAIRLTKWSCYLVKFRRFWTVNSFKFKWP